MGRKRTLEERSKAREKGRKRRNLGITVLIAIIVISALLLLWFWPEGDDGDSDNGDSDLIVACRVSLNCPGCECKNAVRSFEEGRVVVRVNLSIPLNYTESVMVELTANLTNGHTEYDNRTLDLSGRPPDSLWTTKMVLPPHTDLVDLEVRIHTCR